jgi:hypothetical protein
VWVPRPQEVLFIHETSERGDPLLEQHIGKLTLRTESGEIPVRQAFTDKALGEPAHEVAGFVANAVAARRGAGVGARRDSKRTFRRLPRAQVLAQFHVH